MKYDVLIIGSGIAGSLSALELARKGFQVALLSCGTSNSSLAQGGVAYRAKNDSAELFEQDILSAGGGLCHEPTVRNFCSIAPLILKKLLIERYPVSFDYEQDALSLTMEAAHSRARIIHHSDQTGKAIMHTLNAAVSDEPNIALFPHHCATRLLCDEKKVCYGAEVHDGKQSKLFFAKEIILATGGAAGLYLHTSNSPDADGSGIALAYRAGAQVRNMEYVQFHPTSLFHPNTKRHLLTEALRGEGACLLNGDFQPFMINYHELGDLAPRDVVTRAIYDQLQQSNMEHLWLDISFKSREWLQMRFPGIDAICKKHGLDFTQEPIPIVPAAHYLCGGVVTDLSGKTTVKRLSVIGEAACTGMHGANRLASTSLLEGVVMAELCVKNLSEQMNSTTYTFPKGNHTENIDYSLDYSVKQQVKKIMWEHVGIKRSAEGLEYAARELKKIMHIHPSIEAALLITTAALNNYESRGCHFRANSCLI